jgi:hypothetical protein
MPHRFIDKAKIFVERKGIEQDQTCTFKNSLWNALNVLSWKIQSNGK